MSSRQARLRDLFDRARGLPRDEAVAWLGHACADDPGLHDEVLELLRCADRERSPLDEPPWTSRQLPLPGPRALPERVGSYTIVRLIGHGSMGAVYEAIQENPRRTVALKVLRAGLATDTTLRRFQLEADMLARLDHPYVARIHEAGAADLGHGPNPFLVMELVAGLPLDAWAGREGPDLRTRLELLMRIGEGLAHAHGRGVLHRDVKPGNILVDAFGDPRLVDFGVARSLDRDRREASLHTVEGQLVGTLPYMSPEQATGDLDTVDARSDVYALGVVAYELLAGRLPLDVDGDTLPVALRRIQEEEPTRLGALDRDLRGDVETIVATALQKDRDRRYQSMAELVADLRRHLAHEPIGARPTSTLEHVVKFARRHRALAAGAVLLLLGVVAMAVGLVEARRQTDVARAHLAETRRARDTADRARREADQALGREVQAREAAERSGAEAQAARGAMAVALEEAEAITAFVTRALLSVSADDQGHDVQVADMLDVAAARLDDDVAHLPRVAARLHDTLGRAYMAVGRTVDARPHVREAWRLSLEVHGPDDPVTLEIQDRLLVLLSEDGRHEEAIELLDSLEEAWLRREGPEGPHTLEAGLRRGQLLREREDVLEAEIALRRMVARVDAALGPASALAEEARLSHADALVNISRFEEALALLQAVVDARTTRLGAEAPATLAARRALASAWITADHHDEARALLGELIVTTERLSGPAHPDSALLHGMLGRLALEGGDYEEGLRMIRENADRLSRSLGPDNPRTLQARLTEGTVLLRLDRVEEADAVMSQVAEGYRRNAAAGSVSALLALGELGATRYRQGHMEEAHALSLAALEGMREQIGDEHLAVGRLLMDVGMSAVVLERHDEAATWLREAIALYERLTGPDSPDTLRARTNLALVEKDRGNLDAAERLLIEAVGPISDQLGSDHPETLMVLTHLATLRVLQERHAEAEQLVAAALPSAMRRFPAGHQLLRVLRETRARALLGQDRVDEAVALLITLRAELVARAGEGTVDAIAITESLARGLTQQGRDEEAHALVAGFAEALVRNDVLDIFVVPVQVLAVQLGGGDVGAGLAALHAEVAARRGAEDPTTLTVARALAAAEAEPEAAADDTTSVHGAGEGGRAGLERAPGS